MRKHLCSEPLAPADTRIILNLEYQTEIRVSNEICDVRKAHALHPGIQGVAA